MDDESIDEEDDSRSGENVGIDKQSHCGTTVAWDWLPCELDIGARCAFLFPM